MRGLSLTTLQTAMLALTHLPVRCAPLDTGLALLHPISTPRRSQPAAQQRPFARPKKYAVIKDCALGAASTCLKLMDNKERISLQMSRRYIVDGTNGQDTSLSYGSLVASLQDKTFRYCVFSQSTCLLVSVVQRHADSRTGNFIFKCFSLFCIQFFINNVHLGPRVLI